MWVAPPWYLGRNFWGEAAGRRGRRGWFRLQLWHFAGGLQVANSLTVAPKLKSEHAQAGQGIPPDVLVVVTADAKIFHVAGCGVIHIKATERTLTAREAMPQERDKQL